VQGEFLDLEDSKDDVGAMAPCGSTKSMNVTKDEMRADTDISVV